MPEVEVEVSLSDEPDGRGAAVDRERTKVARERLQAKIARMMDQIRIEQASKEGGCHCIHTQIGNLTVSVYSSDSFPYHIYFVHMTVSH